jgi:hypothetical protein
LVIGCACARSAGLSASERGSVDRRTEVWRSQIAELKLAQRSFEGTSRRDHDESLDRPVDRRSPGRPRDYGYGYDEHCANHRRDGAQWANDDRIKGGEAVMLPARRGRLRGLGLDLGIAAAREQNPYHKGCSNGSQACSQSSLHTRQAIRCHGLRRFRLLASSHSNSITPAASMRSPAGSGTVIRFGRTRVWEPLAFVAVRLPAEPEYLIWREKWCET